MIPLQIKALARDVIPAAEVEKLYAQLRGVGFVAELCASHERLRMELEGAAILLAEASKTVGEMEGGEV